MLAVLFSFIMLEPCMCKVIELWLWTQVDKGYSSFVPAKFNRFTAPLGDHFA